MKKRGTLLDAWEQQARATYLLSSKPFTSITSIQKLQGEPNHMGYMTITDEEAYNTAIRYLKGFEKTSLNLSPHTGGYVYPGTNLNFSHNTPNSGSAKRSSSMQIDIEGILKLDQIKEDYSDLEEFYTKPASKDTITSEEARKKRKELEAHIQRYIKPEHRTYQQQIDKAKTAEEL